MYLSASWCTSSKFSALPNLFWSTGIKSVSSSTAITFAVRSMRAWVSTPLPGPISKTVSFLLSSAAARISCKTSGSLRKFWPKLFFAFVISKL